MLDRQPPQLGQLAMCRVVIVNNSMQKSSEPRRPRLGRLVSQRGDLSVVDVASGTETAFAAPLAGAGIDFTSTDRRPCKHPDEERERSGLRDGRERFEPAPAHP